MHENQMDRRDLIKKGAAAGALAWTTPAILTSVATPAAAASPIVPPTIRAGAKTSVGTGNNASVNRPDVVQANDILIAGLMFEKGSSVTTLNPPTGWALIRRTNNGSDVGMATFWKRAVTSDETATSYTFTLNETPKWALGITAWSGAPLTGTPVNASTGTETGEGSQVAAPSVTTPADNCAVLCFYTNKKHATYTPASGTTEVYDHPNTSGGLPSNMLATFVQVTQGNTPARTATASEGEKWCAQQVALRP